MTAIPADIQKAAERVYAQLGRGPDADEQAIAKALMAERERCALIASGDCDWSQFSRTSKKDWRGDEANIFAPPADDDGTMPTDANVFAYRIGIVSGRAIAAAIRSPQPSPTAGAARP